MSLSAIILAGGRATRLGGATKGDVLVGGRSMLDAVTDACRDVGVAPENITVVGGTTSAYRLVVEDPVGSGPAAAIGAGIAHVTTEEVFLLSCDLPFIATALPTLVEHIEGDGVCFGGERPQYLAGLYRTSALRSSLARAGNLVNMPVRAILDPLTLLILPPHEGATDVDSWDDVAQARARAVSPHPGAPGGGDLRTRGSGCAAANPS